MHAQGLIAVRWAAAPVASLPICHPSGRVVHRAEPRMLPHALTPGTG
jgi:hypothetical protein